jgi:hypothetical protein
VNSSSYLEKISLIFMEIGRSVPRHQQMALLYSRSQKLQACVLEYYILVVQFCHSLLTFTQKSVLRQIASTLSDATIKATQSDLSSKAREIEDEVRILIAQRIENEAEENLHFRALTTIFSKTASSQQEIAVKLRILEKCSSHDHETSWKQIRKLGNTTLFSQTTDYVKWRSQTQSCTLLYLGKLGSGKSVMLANIVDDLNLFNENEDASVVYFFVQHDLPVSSKARTIVGSITRQLLRSNHSLITSTGLDQVSLNVDDMLALLRASMPPRHRTYLILDGLNLCSPSARMEVTTFIEKLQRQATVLACVSYRQEPNVELDTALQHLQSCEAIPMPENTLDIETFIETELSSRLESRSLNLGDASLIVEIQDALLEGSKGMFLWVVLQINSLCTMQTDEEIRQALANLPEDLSTIYAQLLKRQQGTMTKYRRRIFELIMAAQRPLTTNELQEALSVTPGDTIWTATKLINEIYAALATCGCLVIIEEEELTVRFVHPTVEVFLLERFTDSTGERLTMETCQKVMADIIVTYLSYEVFGTDVSTYLVPKVKVGSAPAKIISSTMQSSAGAQTLALKLLKLRKRTDFDMGKVLAEEIKSERRVEALEFHFQHYARPYCLQHVSKNRNLDPHITKLLPGIVEKSATNTITFGLGFEKAIEENNVAMARILLSSDQVARDVNDINLPGYPMDNPLSLSLCKGQEQMLELFIQSENWAPTFNLHSLQEGLFPVCYKVYFSRNEDFLRTLITGRGSVITLQHICESGQNVLACAIRGGNRLAAKLLVDANSVDINFGGPGRNPIWEAVRKGDEDTFKVLCHSFRLRLAPGEREALYEEAKRYTSSRHQQIQTALQMMQTDKVYDRLLNEAKRRNDGMRTF